MHGRDCASAIATPIVEQDNKKLFENSISLLKDIEQTVTTQRSKPKGEEGCVYACSPKGTEVTAEDNLYS
jgi:hypothetical protein